MRTKHGRFVFIHVFTTSVVNVQAKASENVATPLLSRSLSCFIRHLSMAVIPGFSTPLLQGSSQRCFAIFSDVGKISVEESKLYGNGL